MNKISSDVLANGLTVISSENQNSPIVTIAIVIKAGSRYETAAEWGYSHILEHMLLKGTKRRPTSYDIGVEIDCIGAYSNAFTNKEFVAFLMQASAEHGEKIFEIASENILSSIIDPGTLENEKKVILEELKRARDNQEQYAATVSVSQLFPDHPLSKDAIGSPETIQSASREQLLSYYSKNYGPNNAVLIVSGNIAREHAVILAERYFKDWQVVSHPKNSEPPLIQNQSPAYHEPRDIQQTHVRFLFGLPGIHTMRESLMLDMLANHLGYGYSSILKQELRSKRGLVYGIRAFNSTFTDASIFGIATSTSQPQEVVQTLRDIVEKLPATVTADQFEIMKTQLISLLSRRIANPLDEIAFIQDGFILYNDLLTLDAVKNSLSEIDFVAMKEFIEHNIRPEKSFVATFGKSPEEA